MHTVCASVRVCKFGGLGAWALLSQPIITGALEHVDDELASPFSATPSVLHSRRSSEYPLRRVVTVMNLFRLLGKSCCSLVCVC